MFLSRLENKTHLFSEISSSRIAASANRCGRFVVLLGRFLGPLGGPTTPVLVRPARNDALALSTAPDNVNVFFPHYEVVNFVLQKNIRNLY